MFLVIMRPLIRRLDRLLRSRLGIVELCDTPEFVFRVRVAAATRPLRTLTSEIPARARLLELHLWNERVPPAAAAQPNSVACAVKLHRMIGSSLRTLAVRLREDDRLTGISAVGGTATIAAAAAGSCAGAILARLGFALTPHRCKSGRIGEFWEKVHSWMITWAFGSGTVRHHGPLQTRRVEFWITADEFVRRYAR